MNEKLFRLWLADMTPEKADMLAGLEKSVRLLTHVKELTGDVDQKLLGNVMDASKAVKEAYREAR